jgi:hypothetical protein
MYEQCGECSQEEKINALYEKVITGNGEGPIVGRVKSLEANMATALPILKDLKTAADRQEGRDLQRLEDEQQRDKAWGKFRQSLIVIAAIGTLVLGMLQLNKQFRSGLITVPKISGPRDAGQVYDAHNGQPQDAATPTIADRR